MNLVYFFCKHLDILSDRLTSRHTSLIDINMYIYFLLQIWIKTQNYPTTQSMDAVDVFPYLDWEKVSTLTPEVTNSYNSLSEPSRRQTNDYACERSRKTIKHIKNCSRHVESHVTTSMFLVWI